MCLLSCVKSGLVALTIDAGLIELAQFLELKFLRSHLLFSPFFARGSLTP